MFKKLLNWLGIKPKQYVSVEDLVASYDPSTQQVGVRKGALDAVNFKRFMNGNRFMFSGETNPFVIIPKPRRDDEQSIK